MFSLRNLTINHRLWLMTLLSVLGLVVTTLIALQAYHSSLMEEKALQTRVLVETAYSIIAGLEKEMKSGRISKEQAQQAAKDEIKVLRYDEDNYFWINDMNARIVMHAAKPELDGKDLSTFTDAEGKRIFVAFADKVKRDGEGVVPYFFPKPGSDKSVGKVSYVKGFTPWGWVIGTGVYVDDVEEAYYSNALSLGFTAVVILVILVSLALLISRSISSPLNDTTEALDDISMGEGDLTRRLNEKGSDEITKLSISFNRFTDKILQIIIKVSQISTQLATASAQLSSTTAETHENLSQQQLETQQVATAVTEMAATVKEIAESAEGAAESARSADKEAQSGKLAVVDVTDAINNLSGEMISASDVINLLAKESENIGSVLDVIRGIAEQTSLLALNAAIEAARAGEQGRGFAVVADEVRTLSSRTQEATTKIKDMIERLQSGTEDAVNVIHRSGDSTTDTVHKAEAAAASLDRIVSSVMLISQRNTQIAGAAEEQSAVAREIDRSVVQISHLAEHSSQAGEQIAQATAELSHLGESLHEMISHFKTA